MRNKAFLLLFAPLFAIAVVGLTMLAGAAGSEPNATVSGTVKNRSSPIANSTVTLYAAGTAGYGSLPATLGSTISDAGGAFTIDYTCPTENPVVYLIATGGDAGKGDNAGIGLMAMLGRCGTSASPSTAVLNEMTTVSAQWTMAQFIDVTGQDIGAPSDNIAGLVSAAGLGQSMLVDTATGALAASGKQRPVRQTRHPQTAMRSARSARWRMSSRPASAAQAHHQANAANSSSRPACRLTQPR